jgi:hypothetical protein
MVTGTYYANPNPVYQPAMRLISAITNSFPATITTTFAHQYISGTIVRIDIPFADGMQQLDQQTAPITVLNATQFSIPIDTTAYTVFAIPAGAPPFINTAAQVVPIGEINSILDAATVNVL